MAVACSTIGLRHLLRPGMRNISRRGGGRHTPAASSALTRRDTARRLRPISCWSSRCQRQSGHQSYIVHDVDTPSGRDNSDTSARAAADLSGGLDEGSAEIRVQRGQTHHASQGVSSVGGVGVSCLIQASSGPPGFGTAEARSKANARASRGGDRCCR